MLIAACPNPDCGAPAEIIPWAVAASTSGPVPHVRTLCASKHRFLLPASWLSGRATLPRRPTAGPVVPSRPRAGRNPSSVRMTRHRALVHQWRATPTATAAVPASDPTLGT
jgi:hypothetical protein